MARVLYPADVIRIALSSAEGFPFEHFAQELHAHLTGSEFVPTGGTSDGGADGVLAGLYENSTKPTSFFQASIRDDTEYKIKQTVQRLREVGRDPRTLVYFTSQHVARFDLVEENLSDELDVTIRIRDATFIAAHVNDTAGTQTAFQQHLSHYAAYLQKVGSTKLIPSSAHVESPAVFTFLSQQVDRRKGDTTSLHAMIDALILWALEGTDPDAGIFMSRQDVLQRISGELPSVEALVADDLGPRMEELSKKSNRMLRWHQKEDLFCLPFETRLKIEEENAADVLLRSDVLAGLRARVLSDYPDMSIADLDSAADVALRALQFTFEKQGLEFAAFLNDASAVQDAPDIAASVSESLSSCGIHGKAALRIGPAVFQALRGVFYKSTVVERSYLRRLSNTYALLFILNTEPRLMEFFQDMTGDFYLYVGSDQLLKALSEQYLDPPDQMARNALQIASSLGATLVLTQPVLEEVVGHFRACDYEFRNHVAASEPYMDYELSRQVPHIMIRAYLYARINGEPPARPKSWSAFVQQFCSYEELHHGTGESEFVRYLLRAFNMEFVSKDELEDLVDVDGVAELANKLAPSKGRRELAENDALLAHAVFEHRSQQKELFSPNEFGFSTWWLTGETSILRHTKELVDTNRKARYIMRPEFLLNFVTLAPSAQDSRRAFANIFPTLLGIRLAKRMDEKAFHAVMEKVEDASQMDDDRRGAAIAGIVDRLKGDFSQEYLSDNARGASNAIDIAASRSNAAVGERLG
ncbi:hypothetical protein SAMN06295879_0243 [Agreia bicolorata]|uniref:Uncharacterized protein n=1 Tax=Agreia bicolorata TaxID=110935 RepID=A0A1T4WTV4_9MICO|nr:hypothetical protein [Agreia bicolorata]SKA80793.1 hypothetical protein SAMN06295879_0243 [Agreia bicolorata]